jgi:hypothetical protein
VTEEKIMAAVDTRYHGWKNYETWNIALWIGNDEGLYNLARECESYAAFQATMREFGTTETPDHVAYNDSSLDIDALDELISDLRGEE